MTTLTTTTEKGLGFGTTSRVTKSFETLINGEVAKLSVYRNEDSMHNFKSKNYYTLEYKGEKLGSHNMGKSQLKWQINFITSGTFYRVFN